MATDAPGSKPHRDDDAGQEQAGSLEAPETVGDGDDGDDEDTVD